MSSNKKKLQRIGSLDCVYLPGEEAGPLVVFFHGYGADCWDLVSISESLDLPGATWVFPNGIIEVPIGPGWMGRAWTEIDAEAFNLALASGVPRDLSSVRLTGMERALDASLGFFKSLGVEDHSHLIVGGFSQGAMLTIETILSSSLPVSAAVILSGTLTDEENWRQKAAHRQPVQFFQSHGTQDSVLGFAGAQRLEQLLRKADWKGHLRSFKGGHEIPPAVVNDLQAFLLARIKDSGKPGQ